MCPLLRPLLSLILSFSAVSPSSACTEPVLAPVAEAEGVVATLKPARSPAEALIDADRLAGNGELDAAIAAYRQALAGDGDTGRAARLGLALLLNRQDREREAAVVIAPLLGDDPANPWVMRAWFLHGDIERVLGNHEHAAAAFARYAELNGPAAAYARVEQARVLSASARERALAALAPLLAGDGPAHARRLALRLAGDLEAAAERHDLALARYRALLELAVWTSDRVYALDHIATEAYALGDHDAAAEALATLIARYPYNVEAERAIERMEGMGRPVDPLQAGIVLYRRNVNTRARERLNVYLHANGNRGPGAAVALFYLGALAERRDDIALALENYQESFDADPAGPYAVEALWERAHVLDYSGRRDQARDAYLGLAARFPSSRRAADARFRAGYMSYINGDAGRAREIWGATDSARALFWAGRAAAEQGDAAGSRLAYTSAAQKDPTGYYGLRAAAVLAGNPKAPAAGPAPLAISPADWGAVETWLTGFAGAENTAAWTALTGSTEWQAALELLALDRFIGGSDAAQLVLSGFAAGKPWLQYRLARTMFELGHPHLAQTAAVVMLNNLPAGTPPAPAAMQRLAYPAPWPDLVTRFAEESGVDPLLLYALMRQESAFNRMAGSWAGAYGLTQFIAGTANEVAEALRFGNFSFRRDLALPVNAIRFGAYYLSAQTRVFGGNVYLALAAYNGGGGNANRWARPGGRDDIDRFYEEIDFSETQTYLRTVLHNYAMYRYLYGGATQPTLIR